MRRRPGCSATLALVALALPLLAGCASPEAEPATQAVQAPPEVLLAPPPAAEPPADLPASDVAWEPGMHRLVLTVDGEPAQGLVMVPAGRPTALVVLAHGWGGQAGDHQADLRALSRLGAVAVAMDFRGARGDFNVEAGVEDTVAATQVLQESYPSVDLTLLYGFSMGGEVALLAPARLPPQAYDYVFVGSGVADLETFWDHSPFAQAAIEQEAGGTPSEVPGEYDWRSPVRHAADLVGAGVRRVFVVHAGGDSIVPVEQSERMHQALVEAGQPASLYVVTTDTVEVCTSAACAPRLVLPASHDAGLYELMEPFIRHRVERLPDPAEPDVRGTYDGATGEYDPSDVG